MLVGWVVVRMGVKIAVSESRFMAFFPAQRVIGSPAREYGCLFLHGKLNVMLVKEVLEFMWPVRPGDKVSSM